MPEGLTSIGANVFANTKLIEISIPNSVTSIGENAFYNTGIWNNAADNGAIYVDKWCVGYKGTFTELSLSADTVGIADYAFKGCTGLQSVTLPESNGVIPAGEQIFSGCIVLKLLFVPTDEQVLEYRAASGWESYNYKIFAQGRVFYEGTTITVENVNNEDLYYFYDATSCNSVHIIRCSGAYMEFSRANVIKAEGTELILHDISHTSPYEIKLTPYNSVAECTVNSDSWGTGSYTTPENWILVTDSEYDTFEEDSELQALVTHFEIETFGYYSVLTTSEILNMGLSNYGCGIIFYSENQAFFDGLTFNDMTWISSIEGMGPLFFFKGDGIYSYIAGIDTIIARNDYALGEEIMQVFTNALGEETVNSLQNNGGIVVYAPTEYAESEALECGIGDYAGMDVEITSNGDEAVMKLQDLDDNGYLIVFEKLSEEDLNIIYSYGIETSEIFFIGYSSEYLIPLVDVSENVYQIKYVIPLYEIIDRLIYDFENFVPPPVDGYEELIEQTIIKL